MQNRTEQPRTEYYKISGVLHNPIQTLEGEVQKSDYLPKCIFIRPH